MYGSAMAPHHQMMSGSIAECVSDVENVAIFCLRVGLAQIHVRYFDIYLVYAAKKLRQIPCDYICLIIY